MSNKLIRLLVVDDHDIMRQGLIRLLENQPDLKIVGMATNGRQAIELARQETPDVILMDIVMKEMGGLEATRKILEELPQIKVIMLTMYEEKAFFEEALAAGASGYFLKGSDSDELINTIRMVNGGGTYLAPKMVGE
jgi:DNA-binding NarL/FixJ family response regulator